jgi:small-conductance mechanosensitive channel
MSSLLSEISSFSVPNLLHLVGIFVAALLINRLLRLVSKLIVKPATAPTRAAQAREQQTRTLSLIVYSTGSKIVWALAILTAAQEFGVNVTPVAAIAGLADPLATHRDPATLCPHLKRRIAVFLAASVFFHDVRPPT